MRLVSSASLLVIGAGLAVDAAPAATKLSLAPAPVDVSTNNTQPWNKATKISNNGTRVNIGNASDPVYIRNGTVVNGTKIEIDTFEPPVIPDTLGWVTDYPKDSNDTDKLTVNLFEKGNVTVPVNSTSHSKRELHKRHLPHGRRTGHRDTVGGRPGKWISETHFREDYPRSGYSDRLTIEVMDYEQQPMQSALRIGMVPSVLDPNQFPGYSNHPTPMRRRHDPGQGRLEGGNARRPNNRYLHDNMGIAFPPGTSQSDGYNGRRTQDEDAYEASRENYYPSDPRPRRRHAFVDESEQHYQSTMDRQAPFDQPILQRIENLPEGSSRRDRERRDRLDRDITYMRENAWEYDDDAPGSRRERYSRADPHDTQRRRRSDSPRRDSDRRYGSPRRDH